MSEVSGALKKPQLRGLLHSQIKKNLIIAIGLSIASAVAWKFTICEPRKKRYSDFYSTYDPYKEFERMKNKGLFQSCGPDN